MLFRSVFLTSHEADNETDEHHGEGVECAVPHVRQRIQPIQPYRSAGRWGKAFNSFPKHIHYSACWYWSTSHLAASMTAGMTVMFSEAAGMVLVELSGRNCTELGIWNKKPPMPTQKAMTSPAASPITAPWMKERKHPYSCGWTYRWDWWMEGRNLRCYLHMGKRCRDRTDRAAAHQPSRRYWEPP